MWILQLDVSTLNLKESPGYLGERFNGISFLNKFAANRAIYGFHGHVPLVGSGPLP
jgi:hypothetical protein